MSDFYTRMKAYRERLNLSQKKLAERTEVRRETIVRLEKGEYNPSLKLAVNIAEELHANVEDIFVFADSREAADDFFQRRDACMLEAGYMDLYDQNFQHGYEIGVTEAALEMLARMIKYAKISMSEEKWKDYKKIKEEKYRKYREENPGREGTYDRCYDAEGNLVKERWIEDQKIIMTCMDFPKESWDDVCAFIEKYPELSPIALARRIIRESEYKYI